MGVDVVLYRAVSVGTGRRRHVPMELLPDPDDALLDLVRRVRGTGRTPVLDQVDPVGLLVVPADWADSLLAELDRLAEAARGPAELAHVHRLEGLVHRLRADREMELRFEGD
ncbi:hypothetical protein [Micromonospora endolithica]|uniref:Uncharacterized protein n=1 Tax=Micromonospora endolithica TaxID=230091 RepID=A0A3A9ZLZ6_9ACTN|nr:hypothetical protein [Micromonospora endolithica]RKN49318.1 hypothetical protein D7223_07390 [Micromonospora endolithica]TWJ23501.1 hypothetical protein JD76_03637 [Micromonospora endolithica]